MFNMHRNYVCIRIANKWHLTCKTNKTYILVVSIKYKKMNKYGFDIFFIFNENNNTKNRFENVIRIMLFCLRYF